MFADLIQRGPTNKRWWPWSFGSLGEPESTIEIGRRAERYIASEQALERYWDAIRKVG